MLVHPQFDPVALSLGPVQIHWYGVTYLAAFGLFLLLAARRVRLPHFAAAGWTRRDVEDMLFLGVLGVIVGGRLGYAIFYKPGDYLADPAQILMVWKGGMSFHGGLLGVLVAMTWFARSRQRPAARPRTCRGTSPCRGRRASGSDPPRRERRSTLHLAGCGGSSRRSRRWRRRGRAPR